MRYGVIGTGAIGGFYGSKLAKAGKEMHFLFHRDYEYVCEHGLQVDSCDGDFHLDNVRAYAQTSDMPQCDVVLVCLKSVNNHLLASLLPPLLRPDTVVVLIQNGIGVEADVQKMFPQLRLAAGLAFICSAKTEPGRVSHQCYGSINLANYSCGDTDVLGTVLADLQEAGVVAHLVEYHEARWKKAVWNMPFNGMTVALNTSTDKLLSNPHTRRLIREQMMEVVNAARHMGVHNIDEAFADLEQDVLCRVVHTVDSVDEACVFVEELEAREVSPGVLIVFSYFRSQGVREEHFASDEELHIVGRVIVEELQERRCVTTEAILLEEERHEYAFHTQDEVFTLSTIPNVVREVERHLTLDAVRSADLSYLIYFVFSYHGTLSILFPLKGVRGSLLLLSLLQGHRGVPRCPRSHGLSARCCRCGLCLAHSWQR